MRFDALPFVGVALGGSTEKTALCALKRVYVRTGELYDEPFWDQHGFECVRQMEKLSVEYHVLHLERLPDGIVPWINYGKVGERAAELIAEVGECGLIVDITSTGPGVHRDRILPPLVRRRLLVSQMPLQIAAGEAGTAAKSPGGGWTVPRRDLVAAALMAFQDEQIKVAEDLGLAGVLVEEFKNYTPRPVREELEAWRVGRFDDLLFAVAMPIWATQKFFRPYDAIPASVYAA